MRWNWLPDAVPAVLGVAAEASLLTVFALGAGALANDPSLAPTLPAFGVAALVGLIAARLGPGGRAGATLVFGLAIAAGVLGGIMGPQAGTGLLGPLSLRPGQVLLGLAVLRGAAHGDPSTDELVIDRLLRWGTPLLVLPWLAGLARDPQVRAAFVGPAFEATLSFAVAGLLGLGTARLRSIGHAAGFDWRTNRAWLGMVVLTVLGVALVAVPASALLGLPLESVARGLVGPLTGVLALAVSIVGTVVGIVFGAAIVAGQIVADTIRGALGITPSSATLPTENPISDVQNPMSQPTQLGWAFLVVLAIVVAAWFLARRWMAARADRDDGDGLTDERSIVVPPDLVRPSLPTLRRRRSSGGRPGGAVAAYLALLEDWAGRASLARSPAESPRNHAGRLRAEGRGDLGLDLLVADYELVRFGGRELTPREERRAVERWRRLRGRPS